MMGCAFLPQPVAKIEGEPGVALCTDHRRRHRELEAAVPGRA